MKTQTALVTLIACLVMSFASAQNSIEVTVTNIKEVKGSIRVGLFGNEDDFLKKPLDGKVVKIDGNKVTVVFSDLKAGDYAVSVIHDENDNGELDSNAMGMPKEGFAFGNNAMGMFGPPSFEKAKVTLNGTVEKQEIKLKYF
jgi:uncharacterized protein (DUF2141 family)